MTEILKTIVVDRELRISGTIHNLQIAPWVSSYRVIKGGRLIIEKGTRAVQKEWDAGGGKYVGNTFVVNEGGRVEGQDVHIEGGQGFLILRGDFHVSGGDAVSMLSYVLKTGDMDNDVTREAGMVILENFICIEGTSQESTIRDQGSKNLIFRKLSLGPSKKNGKEIIALRLPRACVINGCNIAGMAALGWRIPAFDPFDGHPVGESDCKIGRTRHGYVTIWDSSIGGKVGANGLVSLAVKNVSISQDPRGGGQWALIEQTHVSKDGSKFTGEIVKDAVKLAPGMTNSAGVADRFASAANDARWKTIVANANATN